MKPEEHYGTKINGKLSAATFRAEFDLLPDGPVVLTVAALTERKSTGQNNLLHLVLRIVAKQLNLAGYGDGRPYTMERVKAYCKAAGLYPSVDVSMPKGELGTIPKDTSELDKQETSDTIDRVIVYFGDMGIIVPRPGDQVEIELG